MTPSSDPQVNEDDKDNIPHPKDLMFNPWRTVKSKELQDLSAGIISELLDALTKGSRPPRRDLVLNVTDIVPSILANLLVLLKDRPQGSRLVVPMRKSKATRYDRRGFHKFPAIVTVMIEAGYIIKHDAIYKIKRTTIEPTAKLKALLMRPEVSLAHVESVAGEETIQLATRPDERWLYGRKQPNEHLDYVDSSLSYNLRKEMTEVNSFLNNFSIILEGQPQVPTQLIRLFLIRSKTDPQNFNLHGRLYGGFWINLKATKRHLIRIDGEPVVDLDFESMFPRLAYHHAGKEAPQGDLYAISGLEAHRDGVKAGLSALLSRSSDMVRLPPKTKSLLPEGWTASKFTEAIALHHPHLVSLFGKDLGLDFMFTESQILLAAMDELRRQGIPALPMHDGMMVPVSKSDLAIEAMRKASMQTIGHELPVSRKDMSAG